MTTEEMTRLLPEECQHITIAPRHKMILCHIFTSDNSVWVVLLTRMPGDSSKAWHMPREEYWKIQPKHGTRDRYIREQIRPTLEAEKNPAREGRTQSLF